MPKSMSPLGFHLVPACAGHRAYCTSATVVAATTQVKAGRDASNVIAALRTYLLENEPVLREYFAAADSNGNGELRIAA